MVKSMVKKQLWIPYFSPGQIYEKKSNQYHAKQIYKNWQWCIPYFIFSNMLKKMQNTAVVIQHQDSVKLSGKEMELLGFLKVKLEKGKDKGKGIKWGGSRLPASHPHAPQALSGQLRQPA